MSSTVLVDPLPPAKKVDGGPAGLAAVRGRFSRLNRAVVIGSAIVLFFILLAIFATPLEHLTENNPYSEHPEALGASSIPQGWGGGISAEHWFGVTPLRGVDLFSIVAHGARISLGIGLASSVVSLFIGISLGLIAGYFGGLTDVLLSRAMDVIFGFPFLIFAIALSAVVPASFPRPLLLTLVLGFFGWPSIARLVRGETMSLSTRTFVNASRTMGAPSAHIIVSQILPNVLPLLIVYATLTIPGRIAAEASLSFLGVGMNPPTPSWGRSISDAIQWIQIDPMYLVFPGGALFLLTLGFNLLGDGLGDALDPRLREVR